MANALKKCVAAIEKQKKIIAAARDKLREVETEVSFLAIDCDEADQCLGDAIEALSKSL